MNESEKNCVTRNEDHTPVVPTHAIITTNFEMKLCTSFATQEIYAPWQKMEIDILDTNNMYSSFL